jgi:hypothetical protein
MAKIRDGYSFQQAQIRVLKTETFDQLARRPVREKLVIPPELRGMKIFVCRQPGGNGGVEVSVSIERRVLLIFVEASTDGFEIFPDGRIVPFDNVHDDEED